MKVRFYKGGNMYLGDDEDGVGVSLKDSGMYAVWNMPRHKLGGFEDADRIHVDGNKVLEALNNVLKKVDTDKKLC